jgi:hypothetical protein
MTLRGWIGCWLIFAASASSQAQVTLEIESRDHRVTPPRVETTFVVSDGLQLATGLTVNAGTAQHGMIYRSSQKQLLVLDHANRSYVALDVPTMQRLAAQLNQLTGGRASGASGTLAPAQVRKTTDIAPCFGYPATRYEVFRDGRLVREMYVTDWKNIDGGREVATAFADMGAFLTAMMASLPMGEANGGPDESVFSSMQEVDGFPVGVREYRADGTIEQEWALRSARREKPDPLMFSPPTEYQQQRLPGS